MTTNTYHVSDPVTFALTALPLPANSLVFICAKGQPGAGAPPGVLAVPGVHFTVSGNSFRFLNAVAWNVGDLVYVVSF